MKFLRLSAAFSAAFLSFAPFFHTPANALEPDSPCFMITASGKVVDFSNSLCAVKPPASTEISSDSSEVISEDNKRSGLDPEELRHEALQRHEALKLIRMSKENVSAVTNAYIPR